MVRWHPLGHEPERVRERLELTITTAVADSVAELIKDRFDDVEVRPGPGQTTVLTVTGLDQAGERALLNLLWDTGHEIGTLSSSAPDPRPGSEGARS